MSTLFPDKEDTGIKLTLPEILFSIQQILSHPNTGSPVQSEAYRVLRTDSTEYSTMVKIQAKKYKKANLIANVNKNKNMYTFDPEHERIESKDVIEVSEGMMQHKTINKRPKQPAFRCNSKRNIDLFLQDLGGTKEIMLIARVLAAHGDKSFGTIKER